MAQTVKKIHLQCGRSGFDSWDWEDLLEKGMATHSSILAWTVAKSQTRLSDYTFIHTHTLFETESCKLVVTSARKELLQGMYRGPSTILSTEEGK